MSLRLSALWPIVPAPGNWWNDDCQWGITVLEKKPVLMPFFSTNYT